MSWSDLTCLGVFLSHWFTVAGVVGGLIATCYALKTHRSNNSLRKWQLIKETYDIFLKENWYEFYRRIQDGDEINLENPEEDKLLNETLTLFDQINYFRTQRFLDKRAWEYIACEIQNFAFNNSVWAYMNKIKRPYLAKGFPENIIPFTGFPDLIAELPKKFWVKIPPELEMRFNALSDDMRSLYTHKAKDIPDDSTKDIPKKLRIMNLRRTAMIRIFARAESAFSSNEHEN